MRDLVTPARQDRAPRGAQRSKGEFVTEVFERYKRMTGDVEEAILEMYLSGISVRKIAGVTDARSRVRVGKDAVSRIARRNSKRSSRLGGSAPWRRRAYPYLYLDATYLKVRWGARVSSMALLVCVGVDEEGFREVLAVEVAGSEKGDGLRLAASRTHRPGPIAGVRLVVSDDHEGMKATVAAELPGAPRQRCAVHFERNVLSQRAELLDGGGRPRSQGDLQGQAPEDGRRRWPRSSWSFTPSASRRRSPSSRRA